MLPYINGNKKIIKRYKGTQVVYNYIPEDTGTTTYADDALVFEFTGDTLTYKLNNTNYTATTSPTIVNLSDLGYDANTNNMFYNLFYNQKNLTKVLHFPKITGTNNPGFGLFWNCKNVEYIDLSNIGNLNSLHVQFRDCTSLKNLNLDNVDLSNSSYEKHNITFYNVPNDIQISMDGCNCESIVTIKQALNDNGIVTYNNNVVTNNNNCTFEVSETIEYNVDFYDINEWETYNEELKADSIYMIVTNHNEYGVSSSTESDISEEVSYEYEQFEEAGEAKIRCTIYYNENNIYEITYKGELPNTDSIVTENTLSFKYLGLTNSNVTINGSLYQITAFDGEPLGDDYYKYTKTFSEPLTDLTFENGNVFELYAIPQTTDVTSFNSMFANSQLTELDLSGLDTYNVTDMNYMFNNCGDLTELNVSGWDISNVTNTTYMFRNCNSLTKLIIGEDGDYNWWYSRLTDDGIQNNVTILYTIV